MRRKLNLTRQMTSTSRKLELSFSTYLKRMAALSFKELDKYLFLGEIGSVEAVKRSLK